MNKSLVKTIGVIALALLPRILWAQSGVSGAAPVGLLQGVSDCGGDCVTVDVFVDVSGLSGVGGEAGLNAFALAFDMDRGDVFASARAGTSPVLEWSFFHTERGLVEMVQRVILVASVPDMTAPNQDYHVATMVLCGSIGDVTFTFVPAESSLGSRLVAGDGPGAIAISAPPVFTIPITTSFTLDWGLALDAWHTLAPGFDLLAPFGSIDVRDYIKMTQCGLP